MFPVFLQRQRPGRLGRRSGLSTQEWYTRSGRQRAERGQWGRTEHVWEAPTNGQRPEMGAITTSQGSRSDVTRQPFRRHKAAVLTSQDSRSDVTRQPFRRHTTAVLTSQDSRSDVTRQPFRRHTTAVLTSQDSRCDVTRQPFRRH